jgi:hypothetical protein
MHAQPTASEATIMRQAQKGESNMKPIISKYGIRVIAVLVLSLALVFPSLAADEPSPDPSGRSTGGGADDVRDPAGAAAAGIG